jgi:hypothetical protein
VRAQRDETGEETPKARRKRAKKRRPTVALANDQLNVSSVRYNDRFLVAGTSLPDKGIEDIGNLMIEKTIGLWRRDTLEAAVASRTLLGSTHMCAVCRVVCRWSCRVRCRACVVSLIEIGWLVGCR